ncbi:DNA alkylation repair protein [Lactobacillus ultunensis]|uniref:DNA alkylation repair enzyme n=1 Tax=Lactobacillus ultunensis DSM 16047 TaxID=525365 RepID=C2EMM6_9LACO|nr:DNA alkylation repair protein [Lactobacillus ultunensis]EEJ72235.1 DNA alkylation repair enzyme [Lactobacillus ultunensis DSM 16047]KRL82918.1 DNA alkylation repair protein [Lactobacillus ultunensis DSM 16047]
MKINELRTAFEQKANRDNAQHMAKYMRNQFIFYGLKTPQRKEIYHDFLKNEKRKKQIDWALLDQAWQDEHREMQYFVYDYLLAMKKYVSYEDLFRIEKFVRTKQWWDTIDALMKVYGYVGLRDARVNDLMLQWSIDPDKWVRRVAIEYQLLRKERMNTDLLAKIIENNFDSEEFFINKAIGWALRDYSKTNPEWVKRFIEENHDHLAKLSISEGSKYLRV